VKRWTGRWTLGGLAVEPLPSDFSCHARIAVRRGISRAISDCLRLHAIWLCDDHMGLLYRTGHLRPEIVQALDGDAIMGRCTGETPGGERCGRLGQSVYPAMPRCATHEDQLPTRWDMEAEDDAPIIQTRWDEHDRAEERRVARLAAAEAAAERDRVRRWSRLQRRGRVVLAEARARIAAEQGALALD
jgi:hypothetical protein